MTINTFYRPDSSMINMLINNMVGGCIGVKNPHGHRFTAILKCTTSSEEFAKVHEHERSFGPSYFGSDKQLEIGVSFSQITFEEFKRLANTSNGRNCSQYFSIVNSIENLKVKPTTVPNLYQGEYAYYWLIELKYTGAEKQFVDLLKGFDFWYDYSDDICVYQRYNKQWLKIQAEGTRLGLTGETMHRIYRELSNR